MRADAIKPASSDTPAEREPRSAGPISLAVSRNELFAGLVLVGFANGISPRAVHSVVENGFAAALLSTFDISVIVWSACVVGISFVLRDPAQPAPVLAVVASPACENVPLQQLAELRQ